MKNLIRNTVLAVVTMVLLSACKGPVSQHYYTAKDIETAKVVINGIKYIAETKKD